VLTGLVIVDLFGWVAHWALHEVPDLWRLHAVHHSSEKLDWFAGVRNHPFAEMATGVAVGSATLATGIDPRALLIVTPLLGFWGLIQHMNVPWRFGWLGLVVVTPRFHRWHHAALSETNGKSVNLAGLLPIWDRVFGTYFMPDREPAKFGAPSENVPDGFFRQLVWALR
jgi:sterol desaturase/sphingolipid hydroxylase (fatty acid hydroxylase superfamily)